MAVTPDDIQMEVDDRELVDAFKKLGKDINRAPEIKQAEKQAGKYLIARGQANLASRNKKRTGRLSKGFRMKLKPKMGGVMAGFNYTGSKGGGANHAHLVDRGTKQRSTKRTYTDSLGRSYKPGINRGKVTGSKFWTDVNNNDTGRAMDILIEGVRQAINKDLN